MKKTYITPSTEVELTQAASIMAVSLPVTEGTDGDTADAREEWSLWDQE